MIEFTKEENVLMNKTKEKFLKLTIELQLKIYIFQSIEDCR